MSLVFGITLFAARPARGVDAFILGGQLGYAGLTGNLSSFYGNSLVFGADLGFRTSGFVDLVYSFQASSHSETLFGKLTLLSNAVSADFHIGQAYDFDFTLGAGPGLYLLKDSFSSATKFGLHVGGAVDVIVSENISAGLGMRFHSMFDAGGNFWTVTTRLRFTLG